jgi:hypothetical protein
MGGRGPAWAMVSSDMDRVSWSGVCRAPSNRKTALRISGSKYSRWFMNDGFHDGFADRLDACSIDPRRPIANLYRSSWVE